MSQNNLRSEAIFPSKSDSSTMAQQQPNCSTQSLATLTKGPKDEERGSTLIGPDLLIEPPFTQSPAEFIGSALYPLIIGLGDDNGKDVRPIRSFASEALGRASTFKEIEGLPLGNDGSDLWFFTKMPKEYFDMNPKPKLTDAATGRKKG